VWYEKLTLCPKNFEIGGPKSEREKKRISILQSIYIKKERGAKVRAKLDQYDHTIFMIQIGKEMFD